MDYEFLDSNINRDNISLPNSDKINPFLLRNDYADIIKAVDFIASSEKFLYIHGFMGTGKRQFINYVCDFLHKDVVKLEYYCKEATVCDDILLMFTEMVEKMPVAKGFNLNSKITTLNVKFHQQISSIKKPVLIILHSFDDIQKENLELVQKALSLVLKEPNVKLIISTRPMLPNVLGDTEEDRKIFLKAFTGELFKEFLESNQIKVSEKTLMDFYKYTRGYYYYAALTVKILQAMKIDLNEFLLKFNQSEMTFDSYLGKTFVNLVPTMIRNFFWFLRVVRHGLTINALAEFELYDEFSIEYLKTNLMIFESNETIYVHDYFLQNVEVDIPSKTEIKLHKYIIGIYEEQLKAPIKDRAVLISRQALRAEIEYHNQRIHELQRGGSANDLEEEQVVAAENKNRESETKAKPTEFELALELFKAKKYTEAIEAFRAIQETEKVPLNLLVEVRLNLARLYKQIADNRMAAHYYELVEVYYKQHKEHINLNYLYYEMTDLFHKMYKIDRAIETIKKVIYSVDTPQSLLVNACTLLGNIYSDIDNSEEAYSYYKKAMESLNDDVENEILAELYFKYALANDDREQLDSAFEYYNKCISITDKNMYKALAYSNLAACYYDNENYEDAKYCFKKAYDIEKANNNYEGIYYIASNLARILINEGLEDALNYLIEAKKSAEFINEDYYILESTIALGDYYYHNKSTHKEALHEYLRARNVSQRITGVVDYLKIERRINDMKLRMDPKDFSEVEERYVK